MGRAKSGRRVGLGIVGGRGVTLSLRQTSMCPFSAATCSAVLPWNHAARPRSARQEGGGDATALMPVEVMWYSITCRSTAKGSAGLSSTLSSSSTACRLPTDAAACKGVKPSCASWRWGERERGEREGGQTVRAAGAVRWRRARTLLSCTLRTLTRAGSSCTHHHTGTHVSQSCRRASALLLGWYLELGLQAPDLGVVRRGAVEGTGVEHLLAPRPLARRAGQARSSVHGSLQGASRHVGTFSLRCSAEGSASVEHRSSLTPSSVLRPTHPHDGVAQPRLHRAGRPRHPAITSTPRHHHHSPRYVPLSRVVSLAYVRMRMGAWLG